MIALDSDIAAALRFRNRRRRLLEGRQTLNFIVDAYAYSAAGFAAPTFRYWRLYMTVNDGSGTWWSLSRLKLMDGATDRALSYTATSSIGAVDPVTNAFDDNLGTEWTLNTIPAAAWIAVDLGATYTLTEYRISSQRVVTGRTPTTWLLQGSDTALTGPWSTVDSRSGETGWGIQETRTYTL